MQTVKDSSRLNYFPLKITDKSFLNFHRKELTLIYFWYNNKLHVFQEGILFVIQCASVVMSFKKVYEEGQYVFYSGFVNKRQEIIIETNLLSFQFSTLV